MSICLYLNLKHDDLDNLATMAGSYVKHLFAGQNTQQYLIVFFSISSLLTELLNLQLCHILCQGQKWKNETQFY